MIHVTPHLGGGVGAVLLPWLTTDNVCHHAVVTLDYANDHAVSVLGAAGVPLYSQPTNAQLSSLMQEADIVLVHFWNHPLLYVWMARVDLPVSRLTFWAHVAGRIAPNVIPPVVAGLPDIFVLTTPLSQSCPSLQGRDAPVIFSTSGVQRMQGVHHSQADGFTVGYVGTVDFAKIHPDYVAVHKQIAADRFLVVGGNDEARVSEDADARFDFVGKVADVRPYLAQMDVFGYLLNPKHFGTCEQVLQEAMAVGVPPVVLDNPCEASIVRDGETGLVAHDTDEYVRLVMRLKEDSVLRQKLSDGARAYAAQHFSLDEMIRKWHTVFEQMMHREKRNHAWPSAAGDSFDLFCASVGEEAAAVFRHGSKQEIHDLLQQPEWQSSSKGTPKQWLSFLGGERLEELCKLY